MMYRKHETGFVLISCVLVHASIIKFQSSAGERVGMLASSIIKGLIQILKFIKGLQS